jgi:hypothetical protein
MDVTVQADGRSGDEILDAVVLAAKRKARRGLGNPLDFRIRR